MEPLRDAGTALDLEIKGHHLTDIHILIDRPVQCLGIGPAVPLRIVGKCAPIGESDNGGTSRIGPGRGQPIPNIDIIDGVVERRNGQGEPGRRPYPKRNIVRFDRLLYEKDRVDPVRKGWQ